MMFTKSEYTKVSNKRPEDITIVAWPKSGMTWVQNIIASIMYDAVGMNTPLSVVQELIPDVHEKTRYMRHSDRMFFKSHGLPKDIDTKYVLYLVRDGRDALLSYYHYLNNTGRPHTWDDLISKYHRGMIWPARWGEHVMEWMYHSGARKEKTVAFIRYEDLLGDEASDAIKQALFDLDFSRYSRVMSQSAIESALGICSFGNMVSREKRFRMKGMKKGMFVRKGMARRWNEELPEEAKELFEDATHLSALKIFGY